MSGVIEQYAVLQDSEWAGRRFYTAQDRRNQQLVYLMAESAPTPPIAFRHPNLPNVQPLAVEGDVRWLLGTVPMGDALEDLRLKGNLSETDMVNMLLHMIDAITVLASFEPPLVPAYLDPAVIRRDWVGRWKLDYFALAHAPESRSSAGKPPGVYAIGLLLYWLLTGQKARMTRVQIGALPSETTPGLQFILIRCLGRSYLSMAELRVDVERAGREHDFAPIARRLTAHGGKQSLPPMPTLSPEPAEQPASKEETATPETAPAAEKEEMELPVRQFVEAVYPPADPSAEDQPTDPRALQQPVLPEQPQQIPGLPPYESAGAKTGSNDWPDELELRKRGLGVPAIPVDDRPWAMPTRPADGFRQFVVPPPPNPLRERLMRWGLGALAAVGILALGGYAAVQLQLVPNQYLPAFLRVEVPEREYPDLALAGGQLGSELPQEEAPPLQAPVARPEPTPPTTPTAPPTPAEPKAPASGTADRPSFGPKPLPVTSTAEPAAPPQPTTPPQPKPNPQPVPQPQPKPQPQPQPTPQPQTPQTPAQPVRQPPQPGTADYRDHSTGALPTLVHIDGKAARWAYLWPHLRNPYLSVETFGDLFGLNILWVPQDGGNYQLIFGSKSIITSDISMSFGRPWLKLTPELQQALGVRFDAYGETGIYFSTRR